MFMFKSVRHGTLAAVGLLALSSGTATAESLYNIGNSLTNDMVPEGVAVIAADSGSSLTVGFHLRANSSLTYIAANPADSTFTLGGSWTTALSGSAWSFITLQPHFGTGSTYGSETAALKQLIDHALAGRSSQARFCIYAAWPSQIDTGGAYAAYWNQPVASRPDQPTTNARQYFDNLYSRLRTDYRGVADICLIPVGEVLARLDTEFRAGNYPGITSVNDLYRDPVHMGDVGRFAAAATVYATLFGKRPQASSALGVYQAGGGNIMLTPELATWVEGIAWDVVSQQTTVAATPESGGSGSTGVALLLLALLLGLIRAQAITPRSTSSQRPVAASNV